MTKLRKTELIVEALFVAFLILIKVYVYLPKQPDLDFEIVWFVVLSFLIIPVLRLLSLIGRPITRWIYTEKMVELGHLINSILGIPFTIFCLIASLYGLSQPLSGTGFSVVFVSFPLFAFSLYIGVKDND